MSERSCSDYLTKNSVRYCANAMNGTRVVINAMLRSQSYYGIGDSVNAMPGQISVNT